MSRNLLNQTKYTSNFVLSTQSNANGVFTKEKISDIAPPPGIIVMWYGNDADIPKGWKFCNGGTVTINGQSFTTPNMNGKMPFGWSGNSSYPLRGTGGEKNVTLGIANIPNHTHGYQAHLDRKMVCDYNNVGRDEWVANGEQESSVTSGYAGGNASGTTDAHNNMPPFRVVRFIIKVDEA